MFYRIPGFIIASICILSLIFALLGCRFSIGYGFIQIDFRRETALRCAFILFFLINVVLIPGAVLFVTWIKRLLAVRGIRV